MDADRKKRLPEAVDALAAFWSVMVKNAPSRRRTSLKVIPSRSEVACCTCRPVLYSVMMSAIVADTMPQMAPVVCTVDVNFS